MESISSRGGSKIAFFVKQGLDNFIDDIINALKDKYEIRKIIVTNYSQIDEGMEWTDICWFEWCDELVIYGSNHKLAPHRKIMCRLHRYEVFTDYPFKVNWVNVDKLIVVAEHIKRFLFALIPGLKNTLDIITIENGVDLNKYGFKERGKGFNIACVGYIHSRKNPVLLLQLMNKLIKIDPKYKLYIAGQFQDSLLELYWNYQIIEMGLKENIIFTGWQKDIEKWLDDKDYILSTSIHESFGYGIAEAMCCGIKPIIHNFIFAPEIWDRKYLFNGIDDAAFMIVSDEYASREYRKYIKDRYSLEKQINGIINMLSTI